MVQIDAIAAVEVDPDDERLLTDVSNELMRLNAAVRSLAKALASTSDLRLDIWEDWAIVPMAPNALSPRLIILCKYKV